MTDTKRLTCKMCGYPFMDDREWASKCVVCWKEEKQMKLLSGDKQVRLLQKEIMRMEGKEPAQAGRRKQKAPPVKIEKSVVMNLIRLCHPDKHQGQQAQLATEVTKWLLDCRREN